MNGAFNSVTSPGLEMTSTFVRTPVSKSACVVSVRQALGGAAVSEKFWVVVAPSFTTIDEADAGGMADFEFHRTIVLASHSQTLAVLHNSMAGLLTHVHRNRRELVQAFPSMKTYLIDDHRRIFEAVVARDPDRADATLRKHFQIGDEYRRRAIVGETDSITASPAANLQTRKRANSRKTT